MKITYTKSKPRKDIDDKYLTECILQHIKNSRISKAPIIKKIDLLTDQTNQKIKIYQNKIEEIKKTRINLQKKTQIVKRENVQELAKLKKLLIK